MLTGVGRDLGLGTPTGECIYASMGDSEGVTTPRDLGLGTPTGVCIYASMISMGDSEGVTTPQQFAAACMFAAVRYVGVLLPSAEVISCVVLGDVLGLRLLLIVQEELLLHALAIHRAALLVGASTQFSPFKSHPLPSPCWSELGLIHVQ